MAFMDIVQCTQNTQTGELVNFYFNIGLSNTKDENTTYSSACTYHLYDDGL